MLKDAISKLVEKTDLTEYEMMSCISEIMEGRATDAQIGAFLTALRMKTETIDEITGAAKAMRAKSIKISSPEGAIDTCGTGGDGLGTFNISTASAFVAAAVGIPVAKHGNRSVSSKSGSADVLEALGVKIDIPPEKVEKCLFETNFAFLFAPLFHPAMRFVAQARRDMGIRTIFNILGPITNPADTKSQIIGIFSPHLTDVIANVLLRLGSKSALVVHGLDGIDEITLSGNTHVSELKDAEVKTYHISPEELGFKKSPLESIIGGSKEVNADIILSVFEGIKGPQRDVVVLNASAAIYISGKAKSIAEGIEIAQKTIDSKKALNKLREVVSFTNS
ncbi:MAG: anthranilate phosphoribosyltransferase [Thermodesulfovibrionales bacterium]|nr:anthranilate phosphoribosyltransferase [Thermodesulfovibrionales bacterium]